MSKRGSTLFLGRDGKLAKREYDSVDQFWIYKPLLFSCTCDQDKPIFPKNVSFVLDKKVVSRAISLCDFYDSLPVDFKEKEFSYAREGVCQDCKDEIDTKYLRDLLIAQDKATLAKDWDESEIK